ncbi:MAG: hypothetical protein ACOYJU_09190, partial [Anaerovoracaceae bacterium]
RDHSEIWMTGVYTGNEFTHKKGLDPYIDGLQDFSRADYLVNKGLALSSLELAVCVRPIVFLFGRVFLSAHFMIYCFHQKGGNI